MTTAPETARGGVGHPVLREVADGVYAYEQLPGGWCLNNAGLVVSAGQAVLVDTAATQARTHRLRAEAERVAPGGPDIVINTHFHGDHVFGNAQFAAQATIIAHEQTRSDMAEAGLALCHLWPGVDWGDPDLALPDVTFEDRLTVRAGELTVELLQVGPAHTASDVIAWVPQRRTVFAGDVVWSGVTPYVLMGSIEGSLAALERLRRLDPRVVVCGHGPVAGVDAIDATESYLRWVLRLAEEGRREGRSPMQTARAANLGPFAALVDPERLVGNLHRAYAELDGLAPGARIDVAASFREMVEFHGGLPHCAA